MKQDFESLKNTPFHGKSAAEIIEHFSGYNFDDDHGHRLEKCEEFHILAQMAVKAEISSN